MASDQLQGSRARRRLSRNVLLAGGPIVAAAAGILTNLATSTWNWWLAIGLAVAILVAVLLAFGLDSQATAAATGVMDLVPPEAMSPRTPAMARAPLANTVPRPELTDMVWRLLAPYGAATPGVLSIEGPGGFGKTTLAMLLCHDSQVADRYPGGVLWATVGDRTTRVGLAGEVGRLCEALSGTSPGTADPLVAGQRLAELLAERAPMLMVVDDVWRADQLDPFLIGGPQCQRLVLTRNAGVAPAGAARVYVNAMTADQAAQALVAGERGITAATLARLLALTGRWPVLVGLAAGTIEAYAMDGATGEAAAVWVADQLTRHGPTGVDVDDASSRDRAVAATLATSLRLLSDTERDCYADLAVLPPQAVADEEALGLLWAARGVEGAQVAAVQRKLVRLRLAIGRWSVEDRPALQLHDVIGEYLRHGLNLPELTARHRRFVDAARGLLPSTTLGWRGAWWELTPSSRYVWDNLAFHLVAAGYDREAAATLCDLRWVEARTRNAGTAAAAVSDLEHVAAPTGPALRTALSRIGQLLTPVEPPTVLGATLASQLAAVPGLEDLVVGYETHLPRPRLANRWPLPRADHEQLDRHSAGVEYLAVSPGGRIVATASSDTTVRLWRTEDGTHLGVLRGHTDLVLGCDFSPDGGMLATASADGTVRIWDPRTQTHLRTFRIHEGRVHACRFTPDGTTVVTVGGDGAVRLSRVTDGVLVRESTGHGTRMLNCAVAPDGRTVAFVDAVGTVRAWDADAGVPLFAHAGHEGRVWACEYSPDGRLLATGGEDGTVRIWRMPDGAVLQTLRGHVGKVYDAAFRSDGRLLATAGADRTIRLWDPNGATHLRSLEGHGWEVWACAFAPDGRLLTADGDANLRGWEPTTGLSLFTVDGDPRSVWDCDFSPDGTLLATAGNVDARLRQVSTGRTAQVLDYPDWVASIQFSPDGKMIASGGGSAVVILWDAATRTRRHVLAGHSADLTHCEFSPDSTVLATTARDGTARLWDTATGNVLGVLNSGVYELFCCAFSPDGSTLALSGHNGAVQLWNTTTASHRQALTGHTEDVYHCAFSPDGAFLATGAQDGRLQLWRAATGETHWLHGHTGGISSCSFSPDGTLLASSGYDGMIRLWHVTERRCICALRVGSPLYGCVWRPDGGSLAAAGLHGTYLFDYLP
ncbi:NB-ARC domain-containing protein [Micromonospora pisi]|nr:NB-ARC domain-containing protein [Micromonospora pisi]